MSEIRTKDKYRFRSASGREVIIEAEPGVKYVDKDSGEELHPVAKIVPVAPTGSKLPWALENLRFCVHCDQLCQKDLTVCPVCHGQLDPLPVA